MNEPWIKLRTKLCTDPRVAVAAKKCGVTPNEMLGALFQLWCIADVHGGHLSAFDADMLDDMVRLKGFTDALPDDWIVIENDGITLPNYDEHNGSTAKRRASEAKRKANARKASASDADKMRTRVEEKREEKELKALTTPPPSAWASELATKIADHVQNEFGKKPSQADINRWACDLERLTRSRKLVPKPKPEEVSMVVEWGLSDFEQRGSWAGWAKQIQSAPDLDKFVKIRSAMKRPTQQAVAVNTFNRVSPEFQRPESYYDED